MSALPSFDPLATARAVKHRLFVARRSAAAASDAVAFRVRRRDALRRAAEGITLPPLPTAGRGEIWGIAMVRNEADVLEDTLAQMASQGVDRVLCVDNGSTDATRDVLASAARDLPVIVGDDSWTAFEQSAKMTVLADAARRAGATWVLPFDADERWMGKDGSIADVLRGTAAPIVVAELVNAFPDPAQDGAWRLDPFAHHDPKIAFRPMRGTVIGMGNHRVMRPGDIVPGLGIVHLPWRSFEQFRAKVEHGSRVLAAAELNSDAGWHWRRLGSMDESGLRTAWRRMLSGEKIPENAWQPSAVTVPFSLAGTLRWQGVEAAREAALQADNPPRGESGNWP
ncbi:hypothetical protein HMPREF3159_09435 [Brachybacterium sp. HMSC06H03]|uniref:glycosyltransferase family 2 protein n=1 Tax=Brachybacterium sp. HMSC06H03 TaxID=1581127 RepID=UPI0008A444E0|nr:glycosyltransferase family 2 protein [Brachybacterium sp. HMSC06H03]OFT56231.1 hypothetical protein HMPREF3159_09435 [Brachybacterium sp. HMSC06H03]